MAQVGVLVVQRPQCIFGNSCQKVDACDVVGALVAAMQTCGVLLPAASS